MRSYEECMNKLEELSVWYEANKGNRNEATTRFTLIDKLLFECLDWEQGDVELEESDGGEYSDYTFSAPRRVLIVEAKKEGTYFEIPLNRNRITYNLNSLMNESSHIKAAIEQVSGYCQRRGIPFAVVTNGHQIISFVACKNDGNSPFEGKALVFSSIAIMKANYIELWNSLSKEGIEKKYLLNKLSGEKIINLPSKLSSCLSNYPGNKLRNIFQADLQIVSELVFEDLTNAKENEKKFLEECYCESGALSQYSLASKNILQTRYASLFNKNSATPTIVPANSKDGISPELLAESLGRRPILLIGDVGVGKTTFIRNLISVQAEKAFKDAITLYIDLGSQGTLSSSLKQFILGDISRQLFNTYEIDILERNFVRGIYHSELERFKKSVYGELATINPQSYLEKEIEFLSSKLDDTEQHLKKSLEHIEKARLKQVVIIIDNADQRSESVQQEAFLIAQEFSEHWPATVFVALRPETFQYSMSQGALSGYHPKAFTINPPRIDKVLEKRLSYALKITNGEIPINILQDGTKIQLTNLNDIIKVFMKSIEHSNELVEFIDNISSGNVRIALNIVKDFFGSGHVDTEKIIGIYNDTGDYLIPLHEFIRAVIYGDGEYYNSQTHNNITNLFDVSSNDCKEHFLLPLVIALISSSNIKSESDGFIETELLYNELQGLGFLPEQIDNAIIRGSYSKLIEVVGRQNIKAGQDIPRSLRATSIGIYHINKLMQIFSYIDAVVVDTPILNKDVYRKIFDAKDVKSRIERAEVFKEYLDQSWKSIDNARTILDWESKSNELSEQIKYIKKKIYPYPQPRTD